MAEWKDKLLKSLANFVLMPLPWQARALDGSIKGSWHWWCRGPEERWKKGSERKERGCIQRQDEREKESEYS